jgi:hypothetical protein
VPSEEHTVQKPEPPVRWAPRVQPAKIRRLYETDARGIHDDELLDEVGYALYSRCRSILHVADAMNGRVHCPQCDTIVARPGVDADATLHCAQCGWATTWGAYYATYRTQELGAGGAHDIFSDFVARWELAAGPREKMLLIDRLIHAWHWETRQQRPKFGLGRPTGVNLIEGNRKQVLAFLDELTYGPSSTPGTQERKSLWRRHRDEVRATSVMERRRDTRSPIATGDDDA